MTNTTISPVYGRGKRKLIRDRTSQTTPGKSDKTIAPTTEDDRNIITVVDQNGNTDLIKTEMIEKINTDENQIEPTTRISDRLRSTNPINSMEPQSHIDYYR